jgi:hypothetical protein
MFAEFPESSTGAWLLSVMSLIKHEPKANEAIAELQGEGEGVLNSFQNPLGEASLSLR